MTFSGLIAKSSSGDFNIVLSSARACAIYGLTLQAIPEEERGSEPPYPVRVHGSWFSDGEAASKSRQSSGAIKSIHFLLRWRRDVILVGPCHVI